MKKRVIAFSIVSGLFVIVFLAMFTWVLLNYGRLETEINTVVLAYGVLGIFIISLVSDLLFQPIGPDIPIVFGIVAGLNPISVYFAGTMGSLVSSVFGYSLGKLYGEEGFLYVYGQKKYDKWKRIYARKGKFSVMIAALTPVPYVPFCWLSGIFSFRRRHFTLYALLPRAFRFLIVVWVTVFVIP